MAKYKQSEFAKLCGINKSSIPTYKERKQIIVEDGLVDDANPTNALFLAKSQEKNKLKISLKSDTEVDQPEVAAPAGKKKKDGNDSYAQLVLRQKQLENEKKIEEIEKLKKQNAKMDGESIPTEIAKSIFAIYGKSITISFQDVSENWLVNLSKLKGLSSSEFAEFRSILINGINDGVLKAQKESKKAIAQVIKEYSQKRDVGEHD